MKLSNRDTYEKAKEGILHSMWTFNFRGEFNSPRVEVTYMHGENYVENSRITA